MRTSENSKSEGDRVRRPSFGFAVVGWGLALSLLGLVIGSVVLALPAERLYAADTLWPESLFRDWLAADRSVRDFSFPPANSWFPDLAAYWLLRALFDDFRPALLALVVVQLTAVALGVLLLIEASAEDRDQPRSPSVLWPLRLLVIAFWFAALIPDREALFVAYVALPVNHTGTFALGLFVALFWWRSRMDAAHGSWSVAYFVAALLGSFSDLYFLVFPLLPLLAAELWAGFRERDRAASLRLVVRATSSLVLPVLCGLGLWVAFKLGGLASFPRPAAPSGDWLRSLARFYDLFLRSVWITQPGVVGVWCLGMLGAISALWVSAVRARVRVRSRVFVLVGTLAALVVPVAGGAFEDAESLRYAAPLVVLPVWGLALVVEAAGLRSLRVLFVTGLLLALGSLAFLATTPTTKLPPDYRPAVVRCLDRALPATEARAESNANPLRGWANYWDARLLNLWRTDASTLPMTPRLEAHRWIVNLADTREPYAKPHFVVGGTAPDPVLHQTLGKPSHVVRCEGIRILLYGRSSVYTERRALSAATRASRARSSRE